MFGTSDSAGRGGASVGSARRAARTPLRTGALVLAALALLALWMVLRGNLDDGPLEAPPGAQDMPVVTPAVDAGLTGPVQTVCAEPLIWAATDLRPEFAAAVTASGQADVCVDVYRLPDEDGAKDYYRAVASGWWTTQARATQWPWQASGEPAGEVWVQLTWDPATSDHFWATEWMALGPCRPGGAGETRHLQGLVASGTEEMCGRESAGIGQPAADVSHVTWSVSSPQHHDATAMTLDIAVPEGEVPEFSLAVRQVDIEG
ncbi:hypothetical protein [Demequina aestuarii]|uniref:hypothetical protein n=1 Tax=Demequina aestuarii TaxID=327095 RepID=UPI000A808010|nr:hypothetical protein [Demequina aestuarii]